MSIGYEGIPLGVKETDFIDYGEMISGDEKLMAIISHNLESLEHILDYNIANQIDFFGIDKSLIPFGRNECFSFPWWEIYSSVFFNIGKKIKDAKIRVFMDLCKTIKLDPMNEEGLSESVQALEGFAKIFKALGLGAEHKLIICIGNNDNGMKEGGEWVKGIISGLDKDVQERLALRNEENGSNIMDAIEIGNTLHIPVVFHNLYHEANPPSLLKSELEWIGVCHDTWKVQDGNQIISYAGNSGENDDSIPDTIRIKNFLAIYESLDSDVDIMLSAKDRNLSAVKCLNCIRKEKDIKVLELEWRKYKYSVLENSHVAYLQIRTLLKEKEKYPVVPFYSLIEEALAGKRREGFVNAAQHVWGYFKKCATENEKNNFLMMMEGFKEGKVRVEEIKTSLWELSVKYEMKYLLESYYFIL